LTSIVNPVDLIVLTNDDPGFGIICRVWRPTGYEYTEAVIERTLETSPGSGSPDTGAAEQVDVLPAREHEFKDTLADEGLRRFYRAKLRYYQQNDSAWTAWADAVPGDLADEPVVVVPEWTGYPPVPTSLVVTRKQDGRTVRLDWTSGGGETFDYEVRFGASWGGGTVLGVTPDPFFEFDYSLLSIGRFQLRVKARNKYGTPSETDLSSYYLNTPPGITPVEYLRDQLRKRKAEVGDTDFSAAEVRSRDLTVVHLDTVTGVLDEVKYPSEVLLENREPQQVEAQKNLTRVLMEIGHDETAAYPNSVEFVSPPRVRYRRGGLSRQGGNKWGTKANVDLGTAIGAEPDTYAPDPTFVATTTQVTAKLYLVSSSNYVAKSDSYVTDTITSVGSTTSEETFTAGDLPAYDDVYGLSWDFEISTIKTGVFTVRVALEMQLNGGSWAQVDYDELIVSGTGTLIGEGGSLSGVKTGLPSGGTDKHRIKLVSVDGPAFTSITVNCGALGWTKATADYASMTPETGQKVEIEIEGQVL
jgi:hypothetical protein